MNKREDLIWDYLDGKASPEERNWVETQIETDDAFREQFQRCQVLQQNLQLLEPEVPSMRFSQNIMDKLPAVSSLATGPLVSTRWMRLFFGGALGIIVLITGGGGFLFSPQFSSWDAQIDRVIDRSTAIFNYIPENMVILGGIIVTSLFLLIFLDRWLQTRFSRS